MKKQLGVLALSSAIALTAASANAFASTHRSAIQHAASAAVSTCTGWATYPATSACAVIPGSTQTSTASLLAAPPAAAVTPSGAEASTTTVTPDSYGSNDKGCSGWYQGSGEMGCKGSANSQNGYPIVLRNGTYNQAQGGSNGFGWAKAYYYHNLEAKPTLDTIAEGSISGSPSNKDYEVAYYYNGQAQIVVVVVADTTDTSFQGNSTPDGKELGVLTAYCSPPGQQNSKFNSCPDAVNSSL